MRIISREREENASWLSRGGGLGRRGGGIGKGAKRSAKPAGRCRAMTLHSVYGSDVDQLYAAHERTYVRHYAMREPTYLP